MNDLDFSFEDSPWEAFLRTKRAGDTVSAANLLTMLEEENEQVVEDALQALEDGGLNLNVFDLPKTSGSGEAALRLRQEAQLVEKGLNPKELEPNDPLRLYLEEVAQLSSTGDEQALAAKCAAADERAMETLTNLGLHRVLEIAKDHVGCGVLLLDLIQEGSLGLWQAIRGYREGDYAAYRDYWIRFYMAKAVFLQARANGVGQKLRGALEDYRAVDERLLSELGRNPTLEEIAEAMGQKGTMSALRRTSAGVYTEADAHTLEEILAAKEQGMDALEALMLPVESVFESLPLLVVEPWVEQHLYNGCPTSRYPAADGRYRVRNAAGQFLGLANIVQGVLRVEKLFVERN